MTNHYRAAIIAAFSLGIAGFAGLGAPGHAAERASDAIFGDDPIFTFPNTGATIPVPTIAAVVTTADADTADQAPTALDAVNDQPDFDSLAAAVAGQHAPSDLGSELRCLAGAIYYEAKGEPLAGQLAVAEVIVNRSRSGRFPRSLCGVVTQAGQFSFVRGGAVPAIDPSLAAWRTALAVAQVALGDAWDSPASHAMFFHARYVSPAWGKERVASIGNHVFYR